MADEINNAMDGETQAEALERMINSAPVRRGLGGRASMLGGGLPPNGGLPQSSGLPLGGGLPSSSGLPPLSTSNTEETSNTDNWNSDEQSFDWGDEITRESTQEKVNNDEEDDGTIPDDEVSPWEDDKPKKENTSSEAETHQEDYEQDGDTKTDIDFGIIIKGFWDRFRVIVYCVVMMVACVGVIYIIKNRTDAQKESGLNSDKATSIYYGLRGHSDENPAPEEDNLIGTGEDVDEVLDRVIQAENVEELKESLGVDDAEEAIKSLKDKVKEKGKDVADVEEDKDTSDVEEDKDTSDVEEEESTSDTNEIIPANVRVLKDNASISYDGEMCTETVIGEKALAKYVKVSDTVVEVTTANGYKCLVEVPYEKSALLQSTGEMLVLTYTPMQEDKIVFANFYSFIE